jgi:hypothetical protein
MLIPLNGMGSRICADLSLNGAGRSERRRDDFIST